MGYNSQKVFRDNMEIDEQYPENKYEIIYRQRLKTAKLTEEEKAKCPVKICQIYARNIKEARAKAGMLLHATKDRKVKPGQHTILSVKLIEQNRPRKTKRKRSRDNSMLENEKAVEQGEHNNETKR